MAKKPFVRETKYLVVGISDLHKYLSQDTVNQIISDLEYVDQCRMNEGKDQLAGVFIRDTSPYYEDAWELVRKEVEGNDT